MKAENYQMSQKMISFNATTQTNTRNKTYSCPKDTGRIIGNEGTNGKGISSEIERGLGEVSPQSNEILNRINARVATFMMKF